MTGDKITYGESIECPGKWRRLDYETTVQEGETVETASIRAEYFVKNFFYNRQEQTPSIAPFGSQQQNDAFIQSLKEEEKPITKEEMIANTISGINQSKTEKELVECWFLIASRHEETRKAYDLKHAELTQNQ